jgi:hypothetical protein
MADEIMQIRSAHHEPGHIVVAAVQGLKLRPEGIMIDPSGFGLGCFDKEIYGSDDIRRRVVAAMFGGYFAERRFCKENSYSILEPPKEWFGCNSDGWDAAQLMPPSEYYPLMPEAERMVNANWPVIKKLAAELQARDWERIKSLGSNSQWWSDGETLAKYVIGAELIEMLTARGIVATLL